MSYARRSAERRRRVLYSTHQADPDGSSASARRYAERMREARRPTAAYGARVHRRLRGRWFSLVPVSRGSLTAVIAGLLLLAAALAAGHYAAVSLPPIAANPDLARPLRLDRPDSLGRWVTCLMTATTAGVCLLIYQLRRYRTDDFEGNYRIWRPVLLVMAFASLNEVAGLIIWSGAIVDMVAGRRVAMRGEDWLRIVVTIGGAVLALRLFAELRRCRGAVAAMAVAWGLLALPAASHWHLFELNSRGRWLLVTVAPTFAHTFFLITFGVYLRSLYREVRQIEEQPHRPLLADLRRWLRAAMRQDAPATRQDAPESPADETPAREAATVAKSTTAAERRRARRASPCDNADEASEGASDKSPKRRWPRFSLGILPKRRRPTGDESGETPAKTTDREADTRGRDATPNKPQAGMKGGGGANNEPKKPEPDEANSDDTAGPNDKGVDDTAEANDTGTKRRRFGLSWLRRRGQTGQDSSETDQAADNESGAAGGSNRSAESGPDRRAASPNRAGPPANDDGDESDGDDSDGDDGIDWANLSKTERRRLRKQMKRQGRAA